MKADRRDKGEKGGEGGAREEEGGPREAAGNYSCLTCRLLRSRNMADISTPCAFWALHGVLSAHAPMRKVGPTLRTHNPATEQKAPHKPQNRPKIPARHPNSPYGTGLKKYPETTRKIPPKTSFPCLIGFPCFLLFELSLAFLSVIFPSFPRILGVRKRPKILAFLAVFLEKKSRKKYSQKCDFRILGVFRGVSEGVYREISR